MSHVHWHRGLREDLGDNLEALFENELGHVFYCLGLTADFRQKPFDTIESHVCLLNLLLRRGYFDSLTYLSSTRVYLGATSTCEDVTLQVQPSDPDSLYNVSKLMGETLSLHSGKNTRVVRLSNVYGFDNNSSNFLSAVLHDAATTGKVLLRTAPSSSKDYVALSDVVRWLPAIAQHGVHQIYNLARGKNVSNFEIAAVLRREGVEVDYDCCASEWSFPLIDNERVNSEFGPPFFDILNDLPELLKIYKTNLKFCS